MVLVRGGALPLEAHLQRLAVVTELVDSDEMIQELRQCAHPARPGAASCSSCTAWRSRRPDASCPAAAVRTIP